MLRPLLAARRLPHHPRKIPKRHRTPVRYEEHLAIHALMIERHGFEVGGGEESERGEDVGVRDVGDVGEVEEVRVVTELETGFGGLVDVDHGWEGLYVTGAKDAGWA